MCAYWIGYVICVIVASLQIVTRPCWCTTTETGVFPARHHLFTHQYNHSVAAVHIRHIHKGLEDPRSCSITEGRGIQRGGNDELLPPILQTRGHDSEIRQQWYRGGAGPKSPTSHKFGDHDETDSLAGRELSRVVCTVITVTCGMNVEPINKRVSVIVRL